MNPEKHGINMGLKICLQRVMFDKDPAQCGLKNFKNLVFKSLCTNRSVN